jgi:hypothetical protein
MVGLSPAVAKGEIDNNNKMRIIRFITNSQSVIGKVRGNDRYWTGRLFASYEQIIVDNLAMNSG